MGREPAVRSASGTFTLAGILPYTVQVAGRGSAAGLPEMANCNHIGGVSQHMGERKIILSGI